jgi:hypothetical protein
VVADLLGVADVAVVPLLVPAVLVVQRLPATRRLVHPPDPRTLVCQAPTTVAVDVEDVVVVVVAAVASTRTHATPSSIWLCVARGSLSFTTLLKHTCVDEES